MLGTGGMWTQPTDDGNTYLAAANYFEQDRWRVPIFSTPAMGYPEGGSVVYNDAIPVAAFVAKLAGQVTSTQLNYLGAWVVLGYLAAGGLAAGFAFALGNRSLPVAVCVAALTVSTKMYILRASHMALSSHFLVLWAFLSYVLLRRGSRRATLIVLLPAVASLLITPYVWAMVMLILGAALAASYGKTLTGREVVRICGVTGVVLIAVMLLTGHIRGDSGLQSFAEGGYGYFSWNIASLLISAPEGIWTGITNGIVRNATGGQYEGESYVGIATMLLMAVLVVTRPRALWQLALTHWILAVTVLACAVFAASNRVYFGSTLLVDVHLPPLAVGLLSTFRATGRFIWPLAYLLILMAPILIARWLPGEVAVPMIVFCAALQIVEASPSRVFMGQWSARTAPDYIDGPAVKELIAQHERVWQYPSWFCGGLGDHSDRKVAYSEYQLQLTASRLAMPMNSVYMSRPLKDCAREDAEAQALQPQRGVLYVFAPGAPARSERIRVLTASPACRSAGWAIFCSFGSHGEASAALRPYDGDLPSGADSKLDPKTLRQDIRGPLHRLSLHPLEIVDVPVTVTNPMKQSWSSSGPYPIRISYQIWRDGRNLAVPALETDLSPALAPGSSRQLMAKVQAPSSPGNYTAIITMIQDQNWWFQDAGAEGLKIELTVN